MGRFHLCCTYLKEEALKLNSIKAFFVLVVTLSGHFSNHFLPDLSLLAQLSA
jgi:hypothetical protein